MKLSVNGSKQRPTMLITDYYFLLPKIKIVYGPINCRPLLQTKLSLSQTNINYNVKTSREC